METYYYQTVTIFEKYPFQSEVKERFVEFYVKTKSKGSKRFQKIEGLRFKSNTSLTEKENYLKANLEKENIKLLKL
jgi:hypothetical protein